MLRTCPTLRAGFTLVEILMASLLLVMVAGGAYSALRQALEVERRFNEHWRSKQSGDGIVEHLSSAIESAVNVGRTATILECAETGETGTFQCAVATRASGELRRYTWEERDGDVRLFLQIVPLAGSVRTDSTAPLPTTPAEWSTVTSREIGRTHSIVIEIQTQSGTWSRNWNGGIRSKLFRLRVRVGGTSSERLAFSRVTNTAYSTGT